MTFSLLGAHEERGPQAPPRLGALGVSPHRLLLGLQQRATAPRPVAVVGPHRLREVQLQRTLFAKLFAKLFETHFETLSETSQRLFLNFSTSKHISFYASFYVFLSLASSSESERSANLLSRARHVPRAFCLWTSSERLKKVARRRS